MKIRTAQPSSHHEALFGHPLHNTDKGKNVNKKKPTQVKAPSISAEVTTDPKDEVPKQDKLKLVNSKATYNIKPDLPFGYVIH